MSSDRIFSAVLASPGEDARVLLSSRKMAALDGIRGLAILLVLVSHIYRFMPPNNPIIKAVHIMFAYGGSGVSLFFVLSGFLITGILLDTRHAANYFTSFYMRRVLRIFPLYYAVLIVVLLGMHYFYPWLSPGAANRKLFFLYVSNWVVLWKGTWNPNYIWHFWSLAVEEQFYVLWPLCVWLLTPANLRRVAIGAFPVALGWRLYSVLRYGPSPAVANATISHVDALLAGALCALVVRDCAALIPVRRWLPLTSIVTLGSCLTVLLLLHDNSSRMWSFYQTAGLSLMAIGFAALILHTAITDRCPVAVQRVFTWRTLTQFGKYSYGIYVYHLPLIGLLEIQVYAKLPQHVKDSVGFGLAYFAFLIALSYFIAKLSYEKFERPMLDLKRHFKARIAATPNGADTHDGD
jgi:peptidoglycan/LPS O-acetylase OafA/YrhL